MALTPLSILAADPFFSDPAAAAAVHRANNGALTTLFSPFGPDGTVPAP